VLPHDAGVPDPTSNVPPNRPDGNPVAGRIEPAVPLKPRDPVGPPPALSSPPDLRALLHALRRRWFAALTLGGGLAVVAALAAWFLLSPKYTAFSMLRVNSNIPELAGGDKVAARTEFTTYMRTQAGLVKSIPVIRSAMKTDEVRRLNLEARETNPEHFIEDELKVEFQDASEFLNVTMSGANSAEVTAVVRAITKAYLDLIVYAEKNQRVQRVAELDKAYTELSGNLKRDKDGLDKAADLARVTRGDRPDFADQERLAEYQNAKVQRDQFRLELLRAQASLNAHNAQTESLKTVRVSEASLESALETDADYRTLRQRMVDVEAVKARYERDAKRPQEERGWQNAVDRLAKLKAEAEQRREEVRGLVKKRFENRRLEEHQLALPELDNRVKFAEGQLARYEKDVERLEKETEKLRKNNNDIEVRRLEVARQELNLNNIGRQLDNLRLELRAPDRITLYQDAELQKKDMKKQILGAIVAPVAVLFVVCMSLALHEHKQRRVHTADQVASGLGIRVVGAVPDLPNLERHLVSPSGEPDLEGHPVLESIDAIRTQLLREAQTEATRVVLVTSAVAGEGKTTLASHLASSLARAGRKTLLIDGDLRRPAVHQLFELPMQPGFSEVLLGEVEASDAVQATTLDNLAVIPAGQWDREVLQALARDGLEGVFEKLREEFDFLVIDSHPVLAATDSLLLGQRADAVILSVMREVSQAPRVYAACRRLTGLNVRVLGAVVNGTDPDEVITNGPSPTGMALAS
jgi:capsular exopolysaccharide synthesis family protein